MTRRTFDGGVLLEEWENPDDAIAQARTALEQQIRSDIQDGLEAIRAASATLDDVISAAEGIEAFSGTSLTQAQIISTLRQLATGVRLLAQGEKLALHDVDYLARLQLRLFDGP